MKKAVKIILDILAWVLLIFALLITLLVFASGKNNGVPGILGYMPMSVQSDSMSPTMKTGDLIIVQEIKDLDNLKEGDVITFYSMVEGSRILITHRIAAVNDETTRSFVTKGDHNPVEDALPAYASDIVGQWTGTRIKGGGRVFDFLQTRKGFFICILIPLAIFFLFELYKFIVALIEVKKPQISEEEEEEIKRKAVEEYLAAQKTGDGRKEAAEAVSGKIEETAEKAEEAVKETVEEVQEEIKAPEK